MSFDWQDYLRLSDALTKDQSITQFEEARYRVAISRAYYAAYHTALDFVCNNGSPLYQPVKSGADHAGVRRHLQKSGESKRLKIAKDLDRLHERRKEADYEEVIIGNPKPLAISSITVASNIIKALESLQQTHKKALTD
jgi:uncharacterized protein (UPF0332 family)